jgi:hypothetical protein
MATDRQIAANRRNALLSTGPRTDAGKAISRRNALDHGLRAEALLLDDEDPVDFERLRDDLFNELAPATAYEEQLVHQLVSLIWRLRRVPVFETAILKWMAYRKAVEHDAAAAARPTNVLSARKYEGLAAADDRYSDAERDQLRLGRLVASVMNVDLTAKLDRHEQHLIRQLKATRMELADHQAARAAREANERDPSPPMLPAASEPVPAAESSTPTLKTGDPAAKAPEPAND